MDDPKGRRGRAARTDERIAAAERVAQPPYWLITTSEARAAGLHNRALVALRDEGRWLQLAHGVHVAAARRKTGVAGELQLLAAVLLSASPLAFAELLSAALVHDGLDLDRSPASPQIAVQLGANGRRHRRRVVPDERIAVAKGCVRQAGCRPCSTSPRS